MGHSLTGLHCMFFDVSHSVPSFYHPILGIEDFMIDISAIIVAAGNSSRMGTADKIFADLCGKPLFQYTLEAFIRCRIFQRIVLVLSKDNLNRARELLSSFVKREELGRIYLIQGGRRRQDSVRIGLESLPKCKWVAIHDGARPCVTSELIMRGVQAVELNSALIPVVPLTDTVKRVDSFGRVVDTLDRSLLYSVQTPQFFDYEDLSAVHARLSRETFTDDSGMFEMTGRKVIIFEGSGENIKVTVPADIVIAQAILSARIEG